MTMICVSRAPIDKLLAYRERMRWSFNWASSHESDFNFDYGVSAGEEMTHDPAVPLLEANELTVLKLLNEQPAVRENLPLISTQNASASGTNLAGYFSEGHGVSTFAREGGTVYRCYSSYARGTEFLMGYYAILDRAPKGRDEGDQPMSWLRRHDEYPAGELGLDIDLWCTARLASISAYPSTRWRQPTAGGWSPVAMELPSTVSAARCGAARR